MDITATERRLLVSPPKDTEIVGGLHSGESCGRPFWSTYVVHTQYSTRWITAASVYISKFITLFIV